jgi:hypothetical protein
MSQSKFAKGAKGDDRNKEDVLKYKHDVGNIPLIKNNWITFLIILKEERLTSFNGLRRDPWILLVTSPRVIGPLQMLKYRDIPVIPEPTEEQIANDFSGLVLQEYIALFKKRTDEVRRYQEDVQARVWVYMVFVHDSVTECFTSYGG